MCKQHAVYVSSADLSLQIKYLSHERCAKGREHLLQQMLKFLWRYTIKINWRIYTTSASEAGLISFDLIVENNSPPDSHVILNNIIFLHRT